MLHVKINEKGETVAIGGFAKVKNIRSKGLIEATKMSAHEILDHA